MHASPLKLVSQHHLGASSSISTLFFITPLPHVAPLIFEAGSQMRPPGRQTSLDRSHDSAPLTMKWETGGDQWSRGSAGNDTSEVLMLAYVQALVVPDSSTILHVSSSHSPAPSDLISFYLTADGSFCLPHCPRHFCP